MRNHIIRRLIGCLTAIGVFVALAGALVGWPWYAQTGLWALVVAGFGWVNWHKPVAPSSDTYQSRSTQKPANGVGRFARVFLPYAVLAVFIGLAVIGVNSDIDWVAIAGGIGMIGSIVFLFATTKSGPVGLKPGHYAPDTLTRDMHRQSAGIGNVSGHCPSIGGDCGPV